ncbi:Uncharacterised protein [BD1-7 clade bacterium]|uniref:Uncharacterized protein n=1 Tax=BD1-7 clade bacterium TaxID=2029982 RepID=A0A5S9Q5U9_9GAMM|nr:Uncharacterised protein [BD1-7 clade bacterium]
MGAINRAKIRKYQRTDADSIGVGDRPGMTIARYRISIAFTAETRNTNELLYHRIVTEHLCDRLRIEAINVYVHRIGAGAKR